MRPMPALFMTRGNAFDEKNDFDHAIADYNEAIRLVPELRGRLLQSRPRLPPQRRSRPCASPITIRRSGSTRRTRPLINNRGIAWFTKGDYDHAIADYSQAIQLDPNLAAAYNNRGDAWRAKGDFVHATADFDRAIKLSPQFALAYDNRGLVSYQKQDYDRAIADFNAAIQLDPNNAHAYNNRGNAYADKGDSKSRVGRLRSGHPTRSEQCRHPLRPRHSAAPQRRP